VRLVSADGQPWVNHIPAPDAEWASADFRVELESWLGLLDAMFDDPGLTRLRAKAPRHPAVRRYDRMTDLALGARLPLDIEHEIVLDVASMATDHLTWAGAGDAADYWRSLIGDEAKSRMVRGMIADGEQFADTLLSCTTGATSDSAAWTLSSWVSRGCPTSERAPRPRRRG
jgi:hypothetical protein